MASPPRSPSKAASSVTRDEVSRRGLKNSENVTTPITPPARYIPSNFSTPGSTYGKEEDAIILQLSARYILAGIEGESHPQCRYDVRPGDSKRVGDYRQYLPKYKHPSESLEWSKWGAEYELWRNDIRDSDMGLVGDRLERAVKEIYNRYLLVDAGNSRLVLVVPSLLPHPVLETILQTLFERWSLPSISLLPTPATTLVAAGLRSGVVVDMGWEETVITVMYEYREVRSHRSTRGMKMLSRDFAVWATRMLPLECKIDLATVEDILAMIGVNVFEGLGAHQAKNVPRVEDALNEHGPNQDKTIELDWPTDAFTKHVSLDRGEVSRCFLDSLIGKEGEDFPDDEEIPIHRLLYNALLLLPADVRGICLSRIVFVGDGATSTSCRPALMSEFTKLVKKRGWTAASGGCGSQRKHSQSELAQNLSSPPDARHDEMLFSDKLIPEERHLREKHKHGQPTVHGVVRQVDTLGSWAGASLLTNLKVKSFVEVQRDRFLSHGLAGASRQLEQSVLPQQRTNTLGLRPKAGERTSWTIAGWG